MMQEQTEAPMGGGLMPQGRMPPDRGQQPGAQPGQDQGMMTEVQQASPEEQEAYEEFVAQGMNLTYDEKAFPAVLEMLKGEGDPMEGLAKATANVIARVATSAEKAGRKLSGDIVFHAGTEIFEDLAELSRRAGIKDYSEDPDALEGAYFRTMDEFRMLMENSGRINRGAAQQDMEKLMAMDESGELEQMLRGLAQNDPRQGEPEQPTGPEPSGLMAGRK